MQAPIAALNLYHVKPVRTNPLQNRNGFRGVKKIHVGLQWCDQSCARILGTKPIKNRQNCSRTITTVRDSLDRL